MDTWKIFDSRGAEFLIDCDSYALKNAGHDRVVLELHRGEEIVAVFVDPVVFFKKMD